MALPVSVGYPKLPSLPTLPALARDASLPNFLSRTLIGNQLGQLSNRQNATFTGINANARQALAGYGGDTRGPDDPPTPPREGPGPNHDPSKGMGEREEAAYDGQRNQANATGMLQSSFANQNIAAAVQRTSLEAQAIANQYAQDINSAATGYANEGARLVGEYAGFFGADSLWALENPEPTAPVPDPVAAPAAPRPAQGTLATPTSAPGSYGEWTGSSPPNIKNLAKAWGVPVSAVRVTPLAGGKFRAWAQAAPNSGPRF